MTLTDTVCDTVVEVTGRTDITVQDLVGQDLLGNGIIDSFGILQLITELESRLGVQLDEDDLTAANFKTVESIATMLAGKQSEE